jgi:hypothetical protein
MPSAGCKLTASNKACVTIEGEERNCHNNCFKALAQVKLHMLRTVLC